MYSRIRRRRTHGRADGLPAARRRSRTRHLRHQRRGDCAAGGTRRPGGGLGRRRRLQGRGRLHQPAHPADRASRHHRRARRAARLEVQVLVDLSTTGPTVAGVAATACGAQRRMGGFAGQRRHRRRHQGHAGRDGVVPQAGVRAGGSDPEGVRQDVLRRREARARADRQAGQQPAGRGRHRPVVGSGGDGREGGDRPQGAHRHHQRRQRAQQRDPGQVPARS